ncbi:hypothetical protein [Halalkalicoccus sp. NIPERK01]|uniref:hypothetical protein n=1 Tax=Halalkalicoccus sp. NIPERK01 TaxID=3053469 RepID=UPI00256F4345|nr:hypothetical protein [Halalkalicoccus sp. NIPERK01]MDL5361315.1 hypothetical protein [Halalkalicoccus sp. NIPERK01]
MAFERVEKQRFDGEPIASIYTDGGVRFNTGATRRWLDDVDSVDVLVDREKRKLGFDPDYSGPHARTVSRDGQKGGASVSCRAPLRQLGFDFPIGETIRAPVERDPDSGLLVVGLDGDLASAWEDIAETDGGAMADSELSAEECPWLEGDPEEIITEVYGARGGVRSLSEVLDAVEQADNTVLLNQRLALGGVNNTRALVTELGLAQPNGALLDPRERSDRIEAMREAFL